MTKRKPDGYVTLQRAVAIKMAARDAQAAIGRVAEDAQHKPLDAMRLLYVVLGMSSTLARIIDEADEIIKNAEGRGRGD